MAKRKLLKDSIWDKGGEQMHFMTLETEDQDRKDERMNSCLPSLNYDVISLTTTVYFKVQVNALNFFKLAILIQKISCITLVTKKLIE